MKLFAIRDYRNLFAAQVIALFGTGLTTVALGLLAYDLAGPDAALVLGTALTIKMVLYVLIAPMAAAFVDRLPRRAFLVILDVLRSAVVLFLPFVSEIWQIYFLIALLQASSAAFTPTFQAVIPDIVHDKDLYTRALSASQVAYSMESLLSPVLAAFALGIMTFNWLFVGTSIGFIVSAFLVLSTSIPNAQRKASSSVWTKATSGIRFFVKIPQLRGILALNFTVASAGAIVIVNTVNYVIDVLGGSQAQVSWMLAASGSGTLLAALLLPKILTHTAERTVMLLGAGLLAVSSLSAAAFSSLQLLSWLGTGAIWFFIGIGMALIITPTGSILRSHAPAGQLPEVFAAQFSLSHLAWLLTYPIAGWTAVHYGFPITWSILGTLALLSTSITLIVWKRERSQHMQYRHGARSNGGEAEGMLSECQCTSAHMS